MFKFLQKRKDKRQNLIKNILIFIQKENYSGYVMIGMSRKNYNLLTGNYFDMVGAKFYDNFQNINYKICFASFRFYNFCQRGKKDFKIIAFKNKDEMLLMDSISNKNRYLKYNMLSDDEFLIKDIIE